MLTRPRPEPLVWAMATLLALAGVSLSADAQEPPATCRRPVLLDAADPLSEARREGPGGSVPSGIAELDATGSLCRTLNPDPRFQDLEAETLSPGRASLYSALLPGMGQRYLGQGRWLLYLGLEAWAWIQFFGDRHQGNALESEYRDLAWSVARRVSSGPRVDGDFDYYESLTKFTESGAWDASPGVPGVQPETDPETFNGSVWELARDIYFPADVEDPVPVDSPAYQNALAYYQERGVTPGFAWSWTGNELQQTVYGDIIQQSDETLRNSTTFAGVIIANHVVSAVDALISARLRLQDPDALSIHILPSTERRGRWGLVVRVAP